MENLEENMGKNKRHYHRLSGFALLIIATIAVIFSRILMPVGGSKAAPAYAVFMDGPSFNSAISSIVDPADIVSVRRDDCSNMGHNPVRVEDSTSSPERIYARSEDRQNLYYCSDANTLYLNKDSSTMFQGFKMVTLIETVGWDTSDVEDMSNMFNGCSSLVGLDVSNFVTNRVIDMEGMFNGCSSLTGLDVTHFDTISVTNMASMFNGCSSLVGLDVSNFDTSNVTDMNSMFAGCSSLIGLDVSHFDTSSVINMSYMFNGCSSLTGLDVGGFVTSRVTNMSYMFAGCSSLIGLNLNHFDTSSVTNMQSMFNGCIGLTELYVDNFVTSGVTNMSYMFSNCHNLRGLDLRNFDTSKVTNMSYMFQGCSNIEILDLNNFDTNRVTNMSYMFNGCSGLTELYVDHFVTSGVTNMSYMFSNCRSLKGIDVSRWDTSKVTNMSYMFQGCSKIEELNLLSFNTSRVTDMRYMFNGCSNLGKLYLDSFVTSGVTNMSYMFQGCSSLGGLDLTNFDTTKVTDMRYMFNGCSSLTDLDLGSFELKKSSINMSYMFQGCSNLNSIKIAHLVTTGVTNTSYMFKNCSSLSQLDLRNWNTSNVTNMNQMFYGCSNLDTIYVSATGFNTTRVTNSNSSNMFYNTSKLIGGHGTKWSSSVVNKTRAVPDSESVSGYLIYDIAVSFQTVSGVELARQIISVSSRPIIPTITGYRILGYYKNTGLTNTFNFNQNLSKYTEIYLDWTCDTGYILKNGECVVPITATFLPGTTFNTTIKTLAAGATVTSIYSGDTLIQQVVRTGNIPAGVTTGLLSTNDSEVPVVGWFDNGVLYYYTEADVIYLNQNSSHMFNNIASTTYIDTSGWDTSEVTNMSYMFFSCHSLTSLDVSSWNTSNVTDMTSMFYECSDLTGLDVSNWNTSNVTNMSYMFTFCTDLTGLDVSNWNTSNVTNMSYIFFSCSSLENLDVSNWNTSNVTNMSYMFSYCSSLTGLDLSNWNTSNVTNMSYMFQDCLNLTGLDISNWNTSSVTNMSYMFQDCLNLTGLDISNWNTSSVTNMQSMFINCSSLTGLDLSNWDTSNVTDMSYMFNFCSSLETIYASTGFVTSGVTNSSNMFSDTPKLVGGHGTKRNSSYTDKTRAVIDSATASGYLTYDIAVSYKTRTGVELARQIISVGSSTVAPTITGYHVLGYYANTGLTSVFNFSQNLRKYTEVYVKWDVCETGYLLKSGLCVAPVTTTFRPGNTFNAVVKTLAKGYTLNINDELYSGDNELFSGDEESYSGGNGIANAGDVDTGIIQILRTGSIPAGAITGLLSTTDSEVPVIAYFDSGIIYYYTPADIIYLNSNSRFMFFREHNLTYVDTSGRDTSNVRTMNYMFGGCNSLIRVDTSSWDTSNVTNMRRMFSTCSSLTGVDVSNWDTRNVADMDHMFNDCQNLKTLDVSSWNTSSVQITQNMFYNCRSLTGLDVHNWNTSSMTDLHSMFSDCRNLETLDVSSWDTSSAIQMNSMFNDCYKLKGLDVHNWNTSNVTDMSTMFDDCRSLTGLNVSGWNTSNVTDMFAMFRGAYGLTGLNVSNWNTTNVTDMEYMFYNCTGLTELDVSSWNTANVTNMSGMFYNCKNLTTIYASTGFITSGVIESNNMFYNTSKLIGGHGTPWSSAYKNKARARLDSETVSGYLTYDIAVSYRDNTVELTRQIINVGSSTVAPSVSKTGYIFSGWYTTTSYTTPFNFNQSIRKYTQVYAKFVDEEDPIVMLSVTTGEAQTGQIATLRCSDGAGVTKYYRGKTEPTQLSTINKNPTSSLTGAGLAQTITGAGTYRLACRDAAGNWAKTSIVINSYTVQNMIDKISGTQGTYNTTNYDTSGTRLPSASTVYLIPSGIQISLSNNGLYGNPISGHDTYVGYTTTNNAGNTLSGTSNTNINGNKSYYRWFNRNYYTLELLAATGIRLVNLPTGYTRVEYVQSQTPRYSNGGGYIDTEYVLSNHSSIEIKAMADNNVSVQDAVATQLFGNNSSLSRAVSFAISNKSVLRFGTNIWTTTTGQSMAIAGGIYIYRDNSGGVYTVSSTGAILKQHLWSQTGEFETEGSFYLFAGNHGGPEYYSASGTRIYRVKVEEDGILQFYGIPCRSGNVYGVYDIIGNKFHPSTGSVALGGGADIPKIGPGNYKYGESVRIAPILKTIGYTFIEWIVNSGNSPEDISFPDTIVTITGNTILTAVAEDITPPKSIFTGTTPADNMCLNNYFTGETLITEVNLKTLSCNISGNESINTYSLYDDSLVLMYNFDNVYSLGDSDTVVKDLSMYENDGIITDNTNVIATGGKWGGSYLFDAGHISVSDDSLTVTGNFTVSARVKPNTVSLDNRHFLSRWYPDDNKRVWSMAVDSDGNLKFLVSKTGGFVNSGITGPNIMDEQWHHAVMIHNGNDVLMYTDGIYIGKIANIGSLNDIPRILTIGNYAGGISFYGYIDEVRMYNRALNTGEIEQLYLSNLSRINVKKWLYSVNYTGLADGLYTYGCNIVDVAWHNTGLTRTMIIDKTPPTVTVNNGIGNESTRITGSVTASDTNAYCGGLTYYWTGDIGSGNTTTSFGWMENEPIIKTGYVNVTDGAGNTTVGAVRFTWKNIGPVNVNITRSPTSTGECGQITFTATGTDTGATLSYQWYTGANCTSPINGATGKTYQKTLNYSGTYSVYVKVSDSQGSGTCSAVNTATWTNIPLTANDFTGSTNVGNSAKTVNWLTLSNAIAGSCETISASVYTNGTKGHCEVSGNNITYTPNAGQMGEDICTLDITDGDGTVKIDIKWKNIDTGIPVCEWGKPMPYCISGGMAGTISLTCTDNVGISQIRVRVNNVRYDAHLLTLGDSNSVAGTSTRKTYTFTYTGLAEASGSTGFILKTNAVLDTSNNGNEVTGPSVVIGVDNLAPDIPIMVTMPEYIQGLSNIVRSTEVRDNGCDGKVQYQFCIKTESMMRTGGDINNEWNSLGRSGAEGVERTGTAPGAKGAMKIVELGNVKGEIQSWYEDGIIYIFTKSSTLKLPADSSNMFANMHNLQSINLGNIDTSSVTNMAGMFAGCTNLSTLDLSKFDMSNVTNVNSMFAGDPKLLTIYVSENFALGVINANNGENMFYGCTSLVGGSGTKYDKDHTNHEYAHIDGGKKNPGYLTQIQKKIGIKAPTDDGFGCEAISDWLDDPAADFTNLIDGRLYYYYVRSRDGLGNTSMWSHPTSSTQDDTDPAISFNKNTGTAAQSHSVIVTVADNTAGLAANQKIKYRWQTGSICSQTASLYNTGVLSPTTAGAHTATVTVTTAGLSDGSYYLCILSGSVADQAGNVNLTTKTSGVFVVDNTKPVCTRGIPTQICISGGMAGTISLTCTDAVGISQTSVLSSNVQYNTSLLTLSNSNTVAGTSGSKTYTFTYTGITNANGTTGFTLKANAVKDIANNGNLATGPSQSIGVDNTGPDAPTLNTATSPTNDTTPTLSWNTVSSDNGCSTITGYDIWVCTDSNCNTATRSGIRSSTTWDVSNALPNTAGTTYYWKVRAVDTLGNSGSWSNVSSFVLDTTAPVCTWSLPSKTGLKAGATGYIDLTCTDSIGLNTNSLSSSSITMSNPSVLTLSNATVTGTSTGRTFRFTYTANNNVSGTTTLTLPANTVKDLATNATATKTSSGIFVDSTIPTAYVEYTYYVSGTRATLTGYSEGITITNNGGSNTMRFPYTGSNFRGVFEYRDNVGNTNSTAVWGWNNEWYITTGFWTNNPTTGEVVNAVYGDGNGNTDRTVYTKLWTGVNCATGSMKIVEVNPGTLNSIPNTLDANTIYVLNGGSYTKSTTLNMNNCSALIGKTDDVVLYTTATLTYQIRSDTKNSVIIDNVKVNGTRVNQYSTGTQHSPNDYGIFIYTGSNNVTISNVESYEHQTAGVLVQYTKNTIIENSQFYDNSTYGIYLYPDNTRNGITINNVQAYGNKSRGIYTNGGSSAGYYTKISINNSQIYNNGSYGVQVYRNNGVLLNNVEIYNNSSIGIYLYQCSGTIINDAKVYNNGSYAVYSETNGLNTKYYGTLQYFGNAYSAVTNAPARLATGLATDYPGLGFSNGSLSAQGSISCDVVTKTNHFVRDVSSTCSERSYSWTTKLDRQPSRYVYGVNQKKQTQPVAYVNGILTKYDTTGYHYNTAKYLGEVNPVSLIGTISMPNDIRYSESQTVTLTLKTNISSATYTITGDVTTVNGTMGAYSKTQSVTLSAGTGYKNIYVTYTANGQTTTDHIIVDYIAIPNNFSGNIIRKYYGSGSDYAKYWEGNTVCDPAKMNVVVLNSGATIPSSLLQDTIYILNEGKYIIPGYRTFAWNCTALVGSGDVVIHGSYNPGSASSATASMFYMTRKTNIIIDNIKLDGTNNGTGGTHNPILFGIWINGGHSRFNTINNIQVFNMGNYGLYMAGALTTLVNNSQFFNNGIYGIYLYSSAYYNTINNVQSFNNGNAGIGINSTYNSSVIQNSQFYNNGQYGISRVSSSNLRVSDTKVYNNGTAGLYLQGTLNSSYVMNSNNLWIFNNPSVFVKSGSVSNDNNFYHGDLKIFGNDDNSLGSLFSGKNKMSTYGWTNGVISNTGEMGCDIVANPRNSVGIFLQTGNLCNTRGILDGRTNTYITGIRYGGNQIRQAQPMGMTIAGATKYYGTQPFDYDVAKPIAYAYPIENTAPTVVLGNNGPKVESNTITWTATGSDDHDELSWLQYSFHSGSCDGPLLQSKSSTKTYSTGFNEPGNLILYVVVYDTMGLTGCTSSTGIWTNTGPTNVTISRNPTTTGECRPITFTASATDTGTNITYQWYTGANCTNAIAGATSNTYTYTLNKSGTYSVYVKVSDSQGSGTCSAVSTAPWTNIAPTLSTSTLTYSTRISGTKLIYSDLFTSMGVIDGSCGVGTIKTGSITCTYTSTNTGSAIWSGSAGHGIQVTPPTNSEGTGTCTVTFVDDEGSTVQGTVKYKYDTAKPLCTRGNPTETCISGGVAGTISLTCTDGVGISQTLVSGTNVQFDSTLLTLGNSSTVAGTSTSKTYTFTYTGKSSVNGSTGFTLKANAVKDTSNNGNVATGPSAGVQIDNAGPNKPSGLTLQDNNNQKPTLKWTAPSENGCSSVAGYEVQVCTTSACTGTVTTGTPTTASWTLGTNLTAGTTYTWRVRAKDGLGNWGNWETGTVAVNSLTFNGNGGSTNQSTLYRLSGGSISLSISYSANMTGWTHLGWNTSSSATTAQTSITLNGNKVVYAIYSKVLAHTGYFYRNGAEKQTNTAGSAVTTDPVTRTCTGIVYNGNTSFTCNITSPNITRANFTILGYNTNSGATSSTWNTGVTKGITGNVTYYAITKRDVTATFKTGVGVTSIGATSTGCTIWNSATTCSRNLTTITCNTAVGYSTPKWNGTLDPGTTITLSQNTTYTGTCTDTAKPLCTRGNPSNTNLKGGSTGEITLTCTDGVGISTTTLASTDIVYSGTLFTLSNATTGGASTGMTFKFIYTANANVNGTGIFILPANKVKDTAGNGSETTGSSVILVDTVIPTAYVQYTYYVSGTLATLTGFNKGGITITNNGGSNTIWFPYTGSNFRGVFEYHDTIGNTGSTDVWGWNNEWYITSGFWTNNPTTGEIINAVYGDGNGNTDGTAYTKLWKSDLITCNPSSMNVVYLEPGYNTIPNNLVANTIYVLNGGTYTKNAITYPNTCSALIGKTDDVVLYSTSKLDYQIYSNGKNNVVVDNVKINGTRVNQYSTGTQHQPNGYGLFIYNGASNNTINRVEAYEMLSAGILIQNTNYNIIVENSQFYDNEAYGVYLYPKAATSGIILNNIQVYGNRNNGIYSNASAANYNGISINNSQIYNNSNYGVYIYREKGTVLNNLEVYNNSSYGIAFSSATDIIINDLKVYNNGSYAFYANSASVKYYGNIQYFKNAQTAYSNSTSSFVAGSTSDYPELGFVDGLLDNTGTLSCDLTTKNNHFVQNVSSTCGERGVSWTTKLDRQQSKYVYGSAQNKQTQPIAYINGTLTKYDTTGYNYNTNKYLGEVNPVSLIGTISMTNDMRYTESQTVPLILRTNISSATYTITGDVTTVNGTMSAYSKTQNVTLSAGYGYKNVYITYTYNGQTTTDHIIINYINIPNNYSGDIINKYYGTGSEYIKTWEQNNVCDPSQMTVQTLNPGTNTIPQALAQNTIYVLNPGTYIISAYRYFNGNCIALVGSGDVIIYGSYNPGTATQTSGTLLYSTHKRNIIIDNIKLDGTNNGNGGTHTPIHDGIYFVGASQRYNTINNIQAFNMGSYGLFLNSTVREILVNNSQFFNNGIDGIYVASSSTYNTFNNIQSFNNKRAGIAGHSYAHIAITNSQLYNNGQYGLYISSNSTQRISDTKIYNNGAVGIYLNGQLNSSYPRYFNNVRIFNNPKATAISGTVNTNRYHGVLKVFANDDNTLTGGFVNNNSTMRTYGWNTGVLSTTGEMGCDLVANPRNSEGVFLQTGSSCNTRGTITGWTNTYITGIMYGNNQMTQEKPMRLNIGGSIKYYGTQTFDYDVTKPIAYAYPIENIAPTVTLANNGPKVESNTITWTATGSDDHDELSWLQYSFHSGSCDGPLLQSKSSTKTYSTGFNEPGNLILYVVVYDTMGLTGCTSSTGIWTNTGPTNVTISRNPTTTGECRPITFTASAIDTGTNITYQWYTGANCTNAIAGATGTTYSYTLNNSGTYSLYVKATDSQGSGTCSAANTASWQDVVLTVTTTSKNLGVITGSKTINNVISDLGVSAGACETITATVTNSSNATCTLNGNKLTITGASNKDNVAGSCTISFSDGDSTKTATYNFTVDTKKPVITITQPTAGWAQSKTVKATVTDATSVTMYYSTGTSSTCNTATTSYTANNTLTFNKESDSGTYVCFKAIDANGNITYSGSNIVNKIDRTAPTYTLISWTGYECSTGTAIISGARDSGAGLASSPYSWAGSYGTNTGYSLYRASTGKQSVAVIVKDAVGNVTTSQNASFTWLDEELQIATPYSLPGMLTGARVISNLTGSTVFNATGYGACETVSITQGTCINATMSLNGGNLTITPSANISGTGSCTLYFTDGDTTKTGEIKFNIQTLQPSISFTGDVINQINPNTSCINRNRFLTKMTISNTPELGDFTYTFNETTNGNSTMKSYHAYDSGLILMYNFDNVSKLGESTTIVKDLSNHGYDGIVNGATWTNNGIYGGAYSFDGINDYIDLPDYDVNDSLITNGTLSAWVKGSNLRNGIVIGSYNSLVISFYNGNLISVSSPSTNRKVLGILDNYDTTQWNHIVITSNSGNITYYLNGKKLSTTSNTDYWYWQNGYSRIGNKVYDNNDSVHFQGQIDEVRIYNRALSQDEIQFLYKSNLSKISTGEWLFQTLNTCLAQTGNYTYSGIVTSKYDYSQNIGRQISTCIPGVSFTGGIDMYLGMGTVSGKQQVFSGQYPINIQVEDWIGRNGWIGSVRISSNFSGENTNLSINSSNFTMKNNVLEDLGHYMNGIIPEYTTGLVQLSASLTDYANINTYQGNNQGTPYFVSNYPQGDFMCNGGIYGDKPYLQLNVPAWTPGDTYIANVYRTIEPM